MDYKEKAGKLREDSICPNCAETIMMTYAGDMGIDEETARKIGTNFGGGMKSGSTCGVVTSALMVLGALGIDNPRAAGEIQRRIRDNHNGMINCVDLLRANAEAGNPKKPHCDGMIMEAIDIIEELRQKY